MKTVSLTEKELEMITWELSQGVVGDGSSYDKRLERLIKKIKEV